MGANIWTRLSAANPAVANRFLAAGTNMANGDYAVANGGTMPTTGPRRLTVTHATVAAGTDTLGTITFTGTDPRGATITDVVVPVADSVAYTKKAFLTVTKMTQAGWAIAGGNDTIQIGCAAGNIVCDSGGWLEAVVVNTTAAGTITLTDATGVIAVLKASIAENVYPFRVNFSSWLQVTLGAASDVTLIHTPAFYTTYSM